MAQHDQVLANADGATFRGDANDALAALFSLSSGSAAPSTTVAYQWWADTTNGVLKQRNAANSAWIVRGSLAAMGILAKTAAYTAVLADFGKLITGDATSAAFSVTLPAAASAGDGFVIAVKKIDASANAVTIDGNGSETIDGATTLVLSARYDGALLRCDGSNWHVVANAIAAASAAVGGNVLALHEGLVVKQVTAATVDIDATTLLLKTTAGLTYKAASVNLTVDITASGANGLDTGSEATGTWYHLWAIYNGTTVAGLMSTSSTAPTMPSGYTYKGYVGAVYNDGSGNLVAFFQRGALVTQGGGASSPALNNGTSTSFATVSLAALVPSTAQSALLRLQIEASSGTAITTIFVSAAGSGTSATYGEIRANTVGSPNVTIQAQGEIVLTTAQQVSYRVAGTNAIGDIIVEGWRY